MIDFIYSCEELEKRLKTPYDLIDIDTAGESFKLRFTKFREGQDDLSVKMGGIDGEFGIVYKSKGISCEFGCDITVGNIYLFYIQLDTAYDILFGRSASAVLENYGSLDRSRLAVDFDKRGRCTMSGSFKNKDNRYIDGIAFSAELDQIYIPGILNAMEHFFKALTDIQGHRNFF